MNSKIVIGILFWTIALPIKLIALSLVIPIMIGEEVENYIQNKNETFQRENFALIINWPWKV